MKNKPSKLFIYSLFVEDWIGFLTLAHIPVVVLEKTKTAANKPYEWGLIEKGLFSIVFVD